MEYWSDGFWNNGMVGIENLSEIGIDFLEIVA
jgi:hypothetical protein